jgi:hypothetical protein
VSARQFEDAGWQLPRIILVASNPKFEVNSESFLSAQKFHPTAGVFPESSW